MNVFDDLGVEIIGDRTLPPLVTFHDIGMTPGLCFDAFFHCHDNAFLSKLFCVFHFSAPGHSTTSGSTPYSSSKYTLEELGVRVSQQLLSLGVTEPFIGLGMGAGAYVLFAAAIHRPSSVSALLIVSPSLTPPGWREWAWLKLLTFRVHKYGASSVVVTRDFISMHYSPSFAEYNEGLAAQYAQRLRYVEDAACGLYIDAWRDRRDLRSHLKDSLSRLELLLFCGDVNPHYVNHMIRINAEGMPGRVQWIKMSDCGNAVFEEAPHLLAKPIELWLSGMGLMHIHI